MPILHTDRFALNSDLVMLTWKQHLGACIKHVTKTINRLEQNLKKKLKKKPQENRNQELD